MMVEVSAPSNIALIKYMGKLDSASNRPTNSSLSWTMNHLRTYVTLILDSHASVDTWEFLKMQNSFPFELSKKGKQRFLKHFAFLKSQMGLDGKYFLIQSANNFPSDCGLASSASSFAALTLATYEMSQRLGKNIPYTRLQLAEFSRQGSGSSGRSLFPVWSVWEMNGAKNLDLHCGPLWHTAIVVEAEKKVVSSSEAHLRVSSSELFHGRPERAEKRLKNLVTLLDQSQTLQTWRQAFEVCWAEFWDMHALFETSQPSFGYMTAKTLFALEKVKEFWASQSDGPLVTMDAGANVHLLWREDQWKMAQSLLQNLSMTFRLINSRTE